MLLKFHGNEALPRFTEKAPRQTLRNSCGTGWKSLRSNILRSTGLSRVSRGDKRGTRIGKSIGAVVESLRQRIPEIFADLMR